MKISFEKANTSHIDTIFAWLNEPHIQEFWDNTQEHKDDILNFIHQRTQTYFSGTTQYWVGYVDNEQFAFILSDVIRVTEDIPLTYKDNMPESGYAIAIDFGIGNKKYLGKGLASRTLEEFVEFYHKEIDQNADTFFIDPDENNPKAYHVYQKAGFVKAGQYIPTQGAFVGMNTDLMVKRLSKSVIPAKAGI